MSYALVIFQSVWANVNICVSYYRMVMYIGMINLNWWFLVADHFEGNKFYLWQESRKWTWHYSAGPRNQGIVESVAHCDFNCYLFPFVRSCNRIVCIPGICGRRCIIISGTWLIYLLQVLPLTNANYRAVQASPTYLTSPRHLQSFKISPRWLLLVLLQNSSIPKIILPKRCTLLIPWR